MSVKRKLIKQLQQQDQYAFDEVYEKYHRLVFYVIISIVKDIETTKDLVQDTFIKMWNNIVMFRVNTNFKAWLMTIAKNTAKDHLRTYKIHYPLDDELTSSEQNMSILNEFNIDAKQVLNDFEYNVVVLTIVYNLKRREVADFLDRPLGTITRVYREAIEKLQEFYSKNK